MAASSQSAPQAKAPTPVPNPSTPPGLAPIKRSRPQVPTFAEADDSDTAVRAGLAAALHTAVVKENARDKSGDRAKELKRAREHLAEVHYEVNKVRKSLVNITRALCELDDMFG